MSDNQYSTLLAVIVPQIIEYIVQNSNVDDKEAISAFYRSKLYSELTNEDLKLWHYSSRTLYAMYQDELLTGSYNYPEGI